ncbi:21509_t:CDS:2 [Rhizophagus irregularis]|nr:21509_t:CDS:2 [Rhizophagus irregularis]
MYPDNSGSYFKGVAFRGNVLIPHENSQLTPWPISVTVLAFNMLMLYPTYKWNRFSLVSALWAVISPMSVAFNMPFNLPLTIGFNIIKLTREDGRKGFRGRWKTFFKTIRGKSPQYTDEESHHQDDDQNRESNQIYDRYHRYEEISRLLALIVAFMTMLWENIHASTKLPTCGFIITDWKNVDYTNCVEFEPAVGWFLIIVYTSICVATFVGIFVMRGYLI